MELKGNNMYQVFEDNKPCDDTGFPQLKGKGWDNSKFNTLAEAQTYALNWLGQYAPDEPLELGFPYNCQGVLFEIRKVS
jgi:hypothetical protein